MTRAVPLLQATGIRKAFGGVEVLHGVDLTVHPGQVLALLGENGAGKSTMVKIVVGDHKPDEGVIRMDDAEYPAITPALAKQLGVRMIFQELNDAQSLTVAENISLGEWAGRGGFVSWKRVREEARRALGELNADIDIDAPVGSLRVGERQLVEIARAIRTKARVLILDEPTAALSSTEVDQLMSTVRAMRSRGVGMVYITHRLDEVLALADDVLVLRDGVMALDRPIAAVDRSQMVSAMIGREMAAVSRPPTRVVDDTPVLEVESYSLDGAFRDVGLTVRAGEVVSLYGKIGSGTAEVAEAIFGLHRKASGTVRHRGGEVRNAGPSAAVANRFGFLPPDRQRSGSFASRSVVQNLAAPSWPDLATGGFVSTRRELASYERWKTALSIRAASPKQPISTLSGGNQQKILLARWLERGVDVLLLVEPTRGVDVGAREDIYGAIRAMALESRMAVLVATSDYEEVIQISDRALVMKAGEITRELSGPELTAAALTAASGG